MQTTYIKGLIRIGIWLGGWLLAQYALAGEVKKSYVNHEDGHFLLHLEMHIEADVDDVYEVLVDYNNIHQLSKSIKKSKWLESRGNTHKVMMLSEGCIWFFCQEVKQVQQVTELPNRYIVSETLPEKSDLEYGRVLWHIRANGKETHISYSADFIPKFWVPPLIGPWLMTKRLLEEGESTINNIEQRAQPE